MSNHKIAQTRDEAWEIQEQYVDKPHGWIQWQRTNVCMDVHCACGSLLHFDESYLFYVKCGDCQRTYMCNGHIELIEVRYDPGGQPIPIGFDDDD